MGRVKKILVKTDPRDLDSEKWWYLWAALVGVIAVLVMVTWSITLLSRNPQHTRPLRDPRAYGTLDAVGVKMLSSPHDSFARNCAQGKVPVMLTNSVVKKWKAQKWSPSYLRSKLKTLRGIYENDNRWFGPYFDRTKPMLDNAVRKNPYRTDIELSAEEFFQRLDNPLQNRYHYFTGDIDQLGEWAYSEIQPLKELLLLNPKRSSVNVWMGQPHVIAHCHYDGYHNFYAQLFGRKKFTLFRPTNWPGLYPYPFLHPSHAQAQVNATDPKDVRKHPLIGRVDALEVILEPGDLLYMPPLWFHEVESLGVSISVNVWTDSQQSELMEKLFSLPLPLDTSRLDPSHRHEHAQWHDPHQQRIGGAVLIFRMLWYVCRYHTCATPSSDRFYDSGSSDGAISGDLHEPCVYFVHQLWATRYRHLMENDGLPSAFDGNVLCEAGDDTSSQAALSADNSISKDVHYGAYLEQVSQLVRGLPSDTWQLWLGNYVEYIAASVLTEVKYVGVFLKHFTSCTNVLATN